MTYGTPAYTTTAPTTALGMNEVVGILKEIYDGQKVQVMTYTDNPVLAMMRKMTRFGGKLLPLPIVLDSNPNAGGTFSTAQANTAAMLIKEFILTRVPGYQIFQIAREAILAAATDEMSFINGMRLTVDQAIQSCVNFLAMSVFRSGTGSIGQISAISTGVITLVDPNSVVQIQIGQVLQANATDGGTPRVALGYVFAMNRAAGTFTVATSAVNAAAGTAGSPGSWAPNDYLLVQGNNNATLTGISGWLPATIASNDSFFSVNRSVDVTRLGGVYYNGASQSVEEALIDSSSLVAREGGKPDVGIVSYSSYSALEKSLGSKTTYTQLVTEIGEGAAKAEIAFRGIMVNGANNQFRVFPDRNCQGFQGWLLEMKTWVLASLGEAPHIFDYEGDASPVLRMASYDSAEGRIGFYAQVGCEAPGHNANVVLGQ